MDMGKSPPRAHTINNSALHPTSILSFSKANLSPAEMVTLLEATPR